MESKMSILHKLIWMNLLFMVAHGLPHSDKSGNFEGNDITKNTNRINYRLPTDVLPSSYIMKFVPNLDVDMFSYEGESYININVLVGNKKTITLHAVNMTFDENYTSLVDSNNQTIKPVLHIIDNLTQFLILDFESPITTGSYQLNLKYTAKLLDNGYGFHRRSFVDENGENVWLAATNFEPTWARYAFPCFDEPAMKATFEISIKHRDNYKAISNMPVTSKIKDNVDLDKIWTNFDVTPVMSTYLVAFVVADFKNISSEDGRFIVWARESKIENCRYALNIGPKILKALEDYTNIRQAVPKMDNIAITSHTSLAMENWGAVIYKEETLLYYEGITTTPKKELITTSISHEFAHQWFGNLVTPVWWDHVWLSEGFANYFQYFITDKVEPEWRMMDKIVVEDIQELAFRLSFQRPLNSKVNSNSEIKLDAVPYYMGGPILRMISHVLTENVFQTGIQQYLKKNEYGAVTVDDFFDTLVENAENVPNNISLKECFNSWNNQAGYPVINVNRSSTLPGHISINQTRYFPGRTKNINQTETISTESWWIPLNFATQSNRKFNDTQPSQWLEPNQFAQEIPLELNENEWLIVNKQQTGFYRVNYDKENWALIADYLNTPNYTDIHVLNRAQLLDDSFNLVLDNYIDDWSVFLNISRYLEQEDDYFVWYTAFRAFSNLKSRLRHSLLGKFFKIYVLKLIEKVENKVGYTEKPEDDHITKLNRINIVKWACEMESVKCAEKTLKSLIEHLDGTKKISADLRNIVFCAGIRTANITIWNKMFDLYLETNNTKDHEIILTALGCSLDSRIIKSYLAKPLDPDTKNRMYELSEDPLDTIVYSIMDNNPLGVDIMLDYVTENLAALNKTEYWHMTYVLPVVDQITTSAQIQKLKSIIDEISTDEEDIRHEYLSRAENNIKEFEKNNSQIASFLLSQVVLWSHFIQRQINPTIFD